jgi:hypothetical protein
MTSLGLAILAQAETQSFRTTELDLPESTAGILLLLGGLVVLFGLATWTSLRDSRFLSVPWRTVLLLLRNAVLILTMLVLLNPRERMQMTQVQKSRVGVLVDTSLSMAYPAADTNDNEAGTTSSTSSTSDALTRAQAVQEILVTSGLLKELGRTHAVSVYTFDSALTGPQAIIADEEASFVRHPSPAADSDGPGSSVLPDAVDDATRRVDLADSTQRSPQETARKWESILQPRGGETRLGEALHQLVGQISGRTLSGLVVLTDGRSNAGLDAEVARLRAERSDTKLITVGVGSPRAQMNLWVAGMQSPSDVHRGDPFDISVVLQGSGIQEQSGVVRLFQQSAGSAGKDRKQVAEEPFQLTESGVPTGVSFQQQLSVPGKYEYVAVAELSDETIVELAIEDNQRRREVEITDRKQKVLIISSGPMREYRFVRNTLYRHSGIESDVWLQTVTNENLSFVSQEAENLLTSFPKTEAELFEYDVIVAFDPNWSLLSSEQQKFLNRWVDEHSGGIIFVAGELFTSQVERDSEKLRDIAVLYPVVLNRALTDLRVTQRANQPWPVTLTPEGRASEFLKIADATGKADVNLWQTFKGIYRSYPVRAIRDGAVVLAEYGNPRAKTRDGQPPFLASQFYGKGRTMFVGSAETWRLRAISAEGHQRFWTGLIREVGQGRRSRGRSRGLLLLDRTEVSPGQAVTIRAQLYDSRMQELRRESVPVSIVDAEGRPVAVPEVLRGDARRPGQFANTFRPARQGVFRVSVPVPESSDVLQASIEVVVPNLESEDPSQNVRLLKALTENTGGSYLSPEELGQRLPDLLPDRSEPVMVDEQLRTLWDRQWLMFVMIGLLGFEWALRRVVRLS